MSVFWLWQEIVLKMRTPFDFLWPVSTKKSYCVTLLWSASWCVYFIRPNTPLLCIFPFCIFLLYRADPQVDVQIRILLNSLSAIDGHIHPSVKLASQYCGILPNFYPFTVFLKHPIRFLTGRCWRMNHHLKIFQDRFLFQHIIFFVFVCSFSLLEWIWLVNTVGGNLACQLCPFFAKNSIRYHTIKLSQRTFCAREQQLKKMKCCGP